MNQAKLLIIGFVWPEPTSSAAGSRMMQIIDLFLKRKFDIIYASPAGFSENAENLEQLGVTQKQIQVNNSDFDEYLKALQPTHVLFDRFMMEEQFGWRVAEHCPEALRILDTEDLHFLRKARQQAYKDKKSFKKKYLYTDIAKREIASILRSDLSLIISKSEMSLLVQEFKINKSLLLYLPFLLKPLKDKDIENLPGFEERRHFISIGNFLHAPNWDKTLFLKEEIWPLIKKELPEAELHVYGAYTSQKVEQLHNAKQGFLIKGRAPNAIEAIKQARVLLGPLRFGAGLKGKFIDAMQAGTPSITTTVGAEGICGDLPWCGEIANTPEEIARQAILLYKMPKRWNIGQKNGFKIINRRFQRRVFAANFFKRLKKLETDVHVHRQQNFVGQILMHHTTQSTKYMSMWIESKNKTST
ncbi:glycosyltransferase family 4 protein [Psychroflexus sp. YR1-1]|uniref:Glycosyltransferase family 4 protein n=1 Tax=Psychroflexus aurantiacus TaxID=2709310 RepID=A0A6B3R155_9FLAO|nr:glycosyltransferase [Psychroflexus aurantiacus]NEV93962.1 glycosyltransferase family 4 protein [Psychroflexus aurantiacus]